MALHTPHAIAVVFVHQLCVRGFVGAQDLAGWRVVGFSWGNGRNGGRKRTGTTGFVILPRAKGVAVSFPRCHECTTLVVRAHMPGKSILTASLPTLPSPQLRMVSLQSCSVVEENRVHPLPAMTCRSIHRCELSLQTQIRCTAERGRVGCPVLVLR